MRWACTRTRISDCFGLRRQGDTGRNSGSLDWRLLQHIWVCARWGWDFIPGMGLGGEETVPVVMVWSGRREVGLHVHNTDQLIFASRAKVALQTPGSNFLKNFWCILGPKFELFQKYFYLRYFYPPYLDFLCLWCCTTLFWTLFPLLGFGSSNS